MTATICEACGHEVQAGDWPFCARDGGPHEKGGTAHVIDDTVTGGARWFHNLGDSAVWIEKRSELNRIMRERGLVHSERKNYSKDDKSPWATRTCLRPGARDPFIHKASR